MDYAEADKLVQQLSAGFDVLQTEYQKLFGQHQALERKLATARDQYNELAKQYGKDSSATPPLSLASSPGQKQDNLAALPSVCEILSSRKEDTSQDASKTISLATCAFQRLRPGLPKPPASTAEGVKIWSGPSADAAPAPAGQPKMPSISESPMEQDFTIEGMPSNLGCPFASMNGKKLSSHAASVLSRYNPGGSAGGAASSTPLSSVSRVNGKESFSNRNRRESHRASFADPIKAEICGLSDHEGAPTEAPAMAKSAVETHVQSNADPGVCPIRFLDQHSPEEVAAYFENHKHDLPRSHEICVKRYQSNEMQVKELDARYGNLVSMIQGLGMKHQPMLPAEPDDEAAIEDDDAVLDAKDAEKVRNWAKSISPQPQGAGISSAAAQDGDGNLADDEGADSDAGEERQQRFARPLRDIRVGESPSRPWGIPVPVKYLEKVEGNASEASSQPARIPSSSMKAPETTHQGNGKGESKMENKGRCPFGFDQAPKVSGTAPAAPKEIPSRKNDHMAPVNVKEKAAQGVAFVGPEATAGNQNEAQPASATAGSASAKDQSRMVFTGPVFIGYSAEDAAKILKESGLGKN